MTCICDQRVDFPWTSDKIFCECPVHHVPLLILFKPDDYREKQAEEEAHYVRLCDEDYNQPPSES